MDWHIFLISMWFKFLLPKSYSLYPKNAKYETNIKENMLFQ